MNKLNKIFIICLGFFIFLIFFWLRFIRERLPRDLPFTLSWLGFFILLYICIVYSYIIYKLLSSKKSNNKFLEYVISYIYFPLERFDEYIKNIPFINKFYINIINKLISKLSFFVIKTNVLYICLHLIPRIILLTILILDIFIFFRLNFIYKALFLSFFILLLKYIKYSLKYYYKKLLEEYKNLFAIEMEYKHAINIVENTPPEDETEDDFIPDYLGIPLEIFIDYQTNVYFEKGYLYPYEISLKNEGFRKYENINKLQKYHEYTREQQKIRKLWTKKSIKNILNLKIIIHYIENIPQHSSFKNINILISLNYILCWLFIIIISFHTLDNINLIAIIKLLENYGTTLEPFSQISLFTHEKLF